MWMTKSHNAVLARIVDVWRVLHVKRDIPSWLTDEADGPAPA